MRSGRSTRQVAAMVFVAIFMAVQVTVPLALLASERPARFGWQMYSGARSGATFRAVHHDGSIVPVSIGDYLPHARLDMDLTTLLPKHVCQINAEVDLVLVESRKAEVVEIECEQ